MTTAPPFDRPPLNNGCFAPADPSASQFPDPCAALAVLQQAYWSALANGQSQEVRYADMWARTHKTDLATLKREIDRLAAICPQSPYGSRRFAVRAGGFYRRHI